MKLSLEQKIEIAHSGGPAQLAGLIHERHPRLIEALLTNQQLPVELVIQLIRKNAVNEDHILQIAACRDWQKDYFVRLELILNPRTPRSVSLKFLKDIRLKDLAVISRRVALHPSLREVAINFLRLRLETMRVGEKITLAKTGPVAVLPQLMEDEDCRILHAALSNYRLTEDDVLQFIVPATRSSEQLEEILSSERWNRFPRIIRYLGGHTNLGYAARRLVFQHVSLPDLVDFMGSSALDKNHRTLAGFTLKQRLLALSLEEQIQIAGTPSRRLFVVLGSVMQAPAVVRHWLMNPLVSDDVCQEILRSNQSTEVRDWVQQGHVPQRPEPEVNQ